MPASPQPPAVYLDFDDVLAQTFVELARFAREAFGKRIDPAACTDFDLHVSLGLTDAEYPRFMERFHAERLLDIPEMPGAGNALRGWLRDGAARPVVVTGRAPSCHADSVMWLEAHGLADVPVLHVDKYGRFAGDPGVVPFPALAERGFALAVDDAPGALAALASYRLCPYAVFDRPWNRDYAPPAGTPSPVARFRSWEELDAFVRALPRH